MRCSLVLNEVELTTIVKANVSSGCEWSLGMLLYELAILFANNTDKKLDPQQHGSFLIQKIKDGSLLTKDQLNGTSLSFRISFSISCHPILS